MTQSSTTWRDSAACRGVEKDFYPASGKNNLRVRAVVKEALAMCRDCPVRLNCLNWAVENKEFYGIWGGTTERERRIMIENHAPFADTTIRMPIVEIGSIMLPGEKESG